MNNNQIISITRTEIFEITTFTIRSRGSGRIGSAGLNWNIRTPSVEFDCPNRRAVRSGDSLRFRFCSMQNFHWRKQTADTITFTVRFAVPAKPIAAGLNWNFRTPPVALDMPDPAGGAKRRYSQV